jgi:hypothetical protein
MSLFWPTYAMASGREGAAVAEAVVVLIFVALAAFAVAIVAGICWGGYKAAQSGESVLRGGVAGIWKGVVGFLVVGAVLWAVLTILGILFAAYALWSSGTLVEMWNILGEAWNGK